MTKFTIRILTAIITFAIGVAIATAWVINRAEQPTIAPVKPAPATSNGPAMEMVFVLDTTGSMGGLLTGAKERIWGIVNEVMQTSKLSSVRVGLVAYRDRGDQYVTQVLPLTDDLDKVYSTLMEYEAAGGGDEPENVRRALAEGVARAGWSRASSSQAQILFLVGDAPPHDYSDEPDTLTTADLAVKQGIIVNTIQCGSSATTTQVWQSIARRGQGQYFLIPQNGGVQTISTPYDEQLSQLGSRLGGTYLAYGGGAGADGERFRAERKDSLDKFEVAVATRGAPSAAADRSVNKALNSKAYIGDLLQDIENGSTKLESVKTEDLPSELQKLSAEERTKEIQNRLAERSEIRKQILALSKQRTEYIAAEQKKRSGGAQNGFDVAVSAALREQLAKKGIR
jgi:Mg-chelatase subunit ChlD